ncbi:cytochrome P450 [Roseomonas frigidaquae]|uniref:Cytochrome P450 n=1 Tax=Falsiroseomonas frigidaquae TaxID=487318 RepID=A0ABX1F1C7_9PROT|nr:cytochrome P450 [Falsiroseomonas frigidaquae]NKE46098.1 cytochrome P450 [Falsiroseomonas frigidaquae]
MASIPRAGHLDSSLAFLREGYEFVGRRCRSLGVDLFRTRLLGRTFHCAQGAEAAAMFYHPGRFTRAGALPSSVLKLLQDEGSVATLDAAAHRHRKAMLMSLMSPAALEDMAARAAVALRRRAESWPARGEVGLHAEFRASLGEAVCDWAGLALEPAAQARLTDQLGAMIDNAGRIGPANWIARLRRQGAERDLARRIAAVREGRATAPEGSALQVIAFHQNPDGSLLSEALAAVELLNILRPTVAIARFMVFAALALHEHPAARPGLAEPDRLLAFVQEVRRLAPFFPIVGGIARSGFSWRGVDFPAGSRFILDLYGTNRDGRSWEAPLEFRPDRFLGWAGNPFTLIPQGGGDHFTGHRCAGEWLTIAVMQAMLRVLALELHYQVPPQDLSVDLSRMPALPRSGFLVRA